MEVILLEKIGKSGEIGAVVKVKNGYARNWLLPQGKALRATPENRAYFKAERKQIEARSADLATKAKALAERLADAELVILRQAGETGQLYGSVAARDIVLALTETLDLPPESVTRDQIQIKRAIKVIGLHEVAITLHGDVGVVLQVNVARNEEEAKAQAEGGAVQAEGGEDKPPKEEAAEPETD